MVIGQPMTSVRPRTFRLRGFRDWRLGAKLLGSFLLLALVPLAISGYIGFSASRDSLLKQGNLTLRSLCKKTVLEIDQYLTQQRESVVALSTQADLVAFAIGRDRVTAQAAASRIIASAATQADYESIAVMSTDGIILLASNSQEIGTRPAPEPCFQEAVKGNTYVSDPGISPVTNRPVMCLSAPIRGTAGGIAAIVRVRITLDGIWQLVERDKDQAGPGTVGMLLDANGIRIAHSASAGNREGFQQTLLFRPVRPLSDEVAQPLIAGNRFGPATKDRLKPVPLPEVAAALANPAANASFVTSADNSKVRHQAAMFPLLGKPWFYVLMVPVTALASEVDRLALYFLAISLGVAIVASVAAVVVSRAITQPIAKLTRVAECISLGDIDAPIEIHRKDEIGELADALSRMQASLQAAMERLRQVQQRMKDEG